MMCRMGRRSRWAALAALPVLLAGCVLRGSDQLGAAATSAAANQDRALAAEAGTKLFGSLVAQLPAPHWSDLELNQGCDPEQAPMWSNPTEARCATTLFRVAGFDSSLTDEIAEFDQVARHSGWYEDSDAAEATIQVFQSRYGKPWGDNHTFGVGDLMGLNYSGPAFTCHGSGPHGQWSASEQWAEAGTRPPPDLDTPGLASGPPSGLFTHSTGPGLHELISAALAAHRYAVIVSLNVVCDYQP